MSWYLFIYFFRLRLGIFFVGVVFFCTNKEITSIRTRKDTLHRAQFISFTLQQMFGFYCWMRTFMVAIRQLDSSSICSQAKFFTCLCCRIRSMHAYIGHVCTVCTYGEHKHIYKCDKAKIAREFDEMKTTTSETTNENND